ncbi:transforming growth factor-beta-induced protein ig-h3-like [Ostrea edulis]|uniref:transforming growth factor-beta-induced protein ig-h3-like n=1 Tax=Ostrea edulis TaxID=37623 RepID=UPI0024AF8AE6|nr:transforming growth factor-beta-induced protein ig-h3-like [Ostrea edulis]
MIVALALTVLIQSAFGGNLVEVLQADGETTLISLVQQAGLADAILGGEFTIFAPTNDAFSKLPQSTLDSLQKDTTALANILKYHVVKGSIHKADASNELQLETLAGTKIRFNIYPHNNVVTVEGSKITHFDLTASNGMVHVIDTVMMPPEGSIVDLVAGNSDLSTLLSKVQSAGLAGALQGDGLTVFAPTNAAFQKLGSHVLNNLRRNPQLLKEILEYHVVPHTEYSAGLYNREYVRTLDSHHDVIRLAVSGNAVTVNRNGHVIKADISATNGVVHIIDHKQSKMIALFALAVLVQSAFGGNLVEVLQNNGETTLISLVQQAGLADALLGGEFTIFAPTNAAFSKLPQSTFDSLQKDTTALANILKYHVVKGSIHKADASNELQLETLAGTKIRFNIYSHNKAVTVEGSKITHFDLTASNGIVHVIDTVMMPPQGSIVDLVAGNSDLSTLLSKVQSAGLAGALQGDALTVFAPTNAAFARLGSHVLDNLRRNPHLLKEILEYHVVPHTEYSAGLYNREHLRTLDTHHDIIRLSVSSAGGVTLNLNSHVTKADISATNGVVHIIDHVLIPSRHSISSILGRK